MKLCKDQLLKIKYFNIYKNNNYIDNLWHIIYYRYIAYIYNLNSYRFVKNEKIGMYRESSFPKDKLNEGYFIRYNYLNFFMSKLIPKLENIKILI